MSTNEQSVIYLEIKGSAQGKFKSDKSRAGEGKSTCVAFRFGVRVPHETQSKDKGAGIARNRTMWITCEWNALAVQCLEAAWNKSEPLDEVKLTFMRYDPGGQEKPYKTMTLKKATICGIDNAVADPSSVFGSDHRDLVRIGVRAEEILVEGGDTKAHYKRKET